MPKFTSESARLAGQKSKRGKAKLDPTIQGYESFKADLIKRMFIHKINVGF